MLEFDGEWRYDTPGAIEPEAILTFRQLIERICRQGQRWQILEHFKSYFASAEGAPHHWSSNESWASTDLDRIMGGAAENAPLFIEAFYDGCAALKSRYPEMSLPGVARINRALRDAGGAYRIDLPRLVSTRSHEPIPVQGDLPSLRVQAKAAIEDSLQAMERALSEGNGRQAVQEALWLLETFSTAFRSEEILQGSIRGRYFNKIIKELRQRGEGRQKHILDWMMQLHGYLSSPSGGGIRHGIDVNDGLELGINEARLYCNLIRSYLTFLIFEHSRLSQQSS